MNSELQSLFDQAVEAQSQAKDIEALALYQSINKQGYTSSYLELNKALIYEGRQDWGRALSSLERAQFLARHPFLASDRLARIQKEIGANRAYMMGSMGEIGGEIAKVIRPAESLYSSGVLIGIFLIVRGLGFRHRGYFLCVGVAALLLIFASLSYLTDKSKYLISDAELRTLPLEESQPKLNISKGAKVLLLREKGKFIEVERPGDFKGWLPTSAFDENAEVGSTDAGS